jgi:hypothetical protein
VYCSYGEQGDRHALVLTISNEDAERWYDLRERREQRTPRLSFGAVIVVRNLTDDHEYALKTAPCGEPCRCAAAALPLEQAGRWFVGEHCTLDGKDATICGRRLEAGIVAELPSGNRVEYAWPTIARVMADGGEFRS